MPEDSTQRDVGAGSIRVLVADGNSGSARLLCEHLEAAGHLVDLAPDGDRALAMAASGGYQLMLLDVHMAVFDAVEVMRRLHLLMGRPLRVIAVTADRDVSGREALVGMGVDGYLTRPVDFARLDQEVDRVLRKSTR